MTFEETREVLMGLPGRIVDVSIGFPDEDGELGDSLAAYSGTVSDVRRGGGARSTVEKWRVWFRDTGPGATCVTLDSLTFVGADVGGDSGLSLEEVQAEEGDEGPRGSTWTVKLQYANVRTDLMIYV